MDCSSHDDSDKARDTHTLRAEKKRHSDRVAQQRHRQRRKEYINDLEAQLRLLKEGGESQMGEIVSENARLRQELAHANRALNAIRELLGPNLGRVQGQEDSAIPTVDSSAPACPEAATQADGNSAADVTTQILQTTTSAEIPDNDLLEAQEAQIFGDMASSPTSTQSSQQQAHLHSLAPDASQILEQFATPAHVLDHVTSWWLDPSGESQGIHQSRASRGPRPEPMSAAWRLEADGTPITRSDSASGFDAMSAMFMGSPRYSEAHPTQPMQRSSDLSSAAALENFAELFGSSESRQWTDFLTGLQTCNLTRRSHAIPPRIQMPPPARDSSMHHILHVARANIGNLEPPTFRDFLLRETTNPLSREIKVYAEPMRKMNKPSEYLAVYWILYLFFKWQAALDEASYQEMPSWLRPTKLQLEVEHHFLFDQVPWPDLREELIKMSLHDMERAFEALVDVGRHLIVNIYTAHEWYGKNVQQLKLDIANLGRWKLDSLFFRKHPDWMWTSAR